jgi:hypothetical protein
MQHRHAGAAQRTRDHYQTKVTGALRRVKNRPTVQVSCSADPRSFPATFGDILKKTPEPPTFHLSRPHFGAHSRSEPAHGSDNRRHKR